MSTKVTYGAEARRELVRGAVKLAEAVSVTMGPRGRLAVIDDGVGIPHLTKDGVTVANAIHLQDPLQNSGAVILREASRKTASEAGDGTTTTCVLASGIMTNGVEVLENHDNQAREFFDGLDEATQFVLRDIEQRRLDVTDPEQIRHVATISANGDEQLGELLASVIEKLGPRATVLIEEARTYETAIEFVDGTEIDRGFVSPHFVNSKSTSKCRFEKPFVVVFNRRVSTLKEILSLLEHVNGSGRPLLMFAEDYEPEVLKGLILNKQRGSLQVCACKLPEFGGAVHESAQDLAALFGCQTVSDADFDERGMVKITDAVIGSAELTETTREKTTVLRPNSDLERVEVRLQGIDEEAASCANPDRELQLERRRRRLTSGIAVLRVGAATEVELKEKLDRVDDAVNATRVAALYGILPGGGDALLRASYNLRDEADLKTGATRAAYEVIAGAIQRPSRVILENACYNVESVLEQFTDKNFVSTSKKEVGFNALSGEFVDLVASGVIDPYYVTKSSLINSLSVAKKVLEVGCVINTGYNTLEDENV